MDPLTVLATAQAAYGAIKMGIAAGKEIQHMAADLSDLWGSLAKLTQLAAEPPKATIFNRQSAEKIAIDRYTAKATAQDLALKARGMFIAQFGLSAWDEVQREVINIRKELERQRYQAEKERQQKIDDLKDAAVITTIVLGSVSLIGLIGVFLLFK
jgi:hypothetical protein